MFNLALRNAKLNKEDLTHTHATTSDMGKLFPVGCVECLPGDWFRIKYEYLVRFLALISPAMHLYRVSLHTWFVPTRLTWKNWTNFITGGEKGDDASVKPRIWAPSGGFPVGSLAQRLGARAGQNGIWIDALPVRAYNLIYNEFYRNEWLQDPLPISLDDGTGDNFADTVTNTDIQNRLWERDFFTDCLPSPQKGPAVSIPLGTSAPVSVFGNGNALGFTDGTSEAGIQQLIQGGSYYTLFSPDSLGKAVGSVASSNLLLSQKALGVVEDAENSGLTGLADLSSASAITINALRQAAAVQQFQENNARSGSRYAEFIPANYGVYCPDASLQRPQYIGGCTSPMVISEVLQTSSSTQDSPQGNMAGHGVSAGVSDEIRFHPTEHGYIMTLMSIMPQTAYFQGVPHWLNRETRYDYGIPLFAHLGERGVKNKEIYAQGNEQDDQIFGYMPLYEEYRRIPNQISGQLTTTLDFWTSARKFDSLPALNSQFVVSNPSTSIFATDEEVPNSDHLLIQVLNHIVALRPLPKQGNPGMHVI